MLFYYCEKCKRVESQAEIRWNCDLSPEDEWDDAYAECPDCGNQDQEEIEEADLEQFIKDNPKVEIIK